MVAFSPLNLISKAFSNSVRIAGNTRGTEENPKQNIRFLGVSLRWQRGASLECDCLLRVRGNCDRLQIDRGKCALGALLRSFDIADSRTASEVVNAQQVMRKGRSTPVSVIGRALKSPAIPVHQ